MWLIVLLAQRVACACGGGAFDALAYRYPAMLGIMAFGRYSVPTLAIGLHLCRGCYVASDLILALLLLGNFCKLRTFLRTMRFFLGFASNLRGCSL